MRIVSQDRNVSIDLDKVIIKILNENYIYMLIHIQLIKL